MPPPAHHHTLDNAAMRVSEPVPTPRRRRWHIEILLFMVALVVYQLSRALVIGDASDAVKHAVEVIDLEKAAGVFFESDVQRWMLDNLHVTKFLNHFYVWAHLPVTALFFVWLYRRRQTAYTFVRNAFFMANGFALAVFVVFPVAPPRLMSNEGFIDTLSIISGIDLHGGSLSGWFNPYAAVPSMHFGYALMIGVVGAVLVRRLYIRMLLLAYPMLVFLTIVGTGNHYVLDALAGGAVMLAAFGTMAIWRRYHRADGGARAANTCTG
jgi:PAP2 superfamily